MRFGTFYFFQAVPWLSHDEVVHRELEQMEWTEELGFDQIWLTEHHFIDYGLAATLQVSAAIPNFLITEYFVNFEPRGLEIASAPLRVEGGYLEVPRAPGLGIDLREDILARHAYREFPARSIPTPRDERP